MNEIALSNDIDIITAEVKSWKTMAGMSIWEIGRRLKHVKEKNLTHGQYLEWLDTVSIDRTEAHRYIKVADNLPNDDTWQHLSARALYMIATLPEDEREKEHVTSSGESKTVDEMTVRELEELKKDVKQKDAEIEELKSREPEVIEKEIVKEVPVKPHDYDGLRSDINQLSQELKEQQAENRKMRNQINQWEDEKGEIDKKSKRYDELSQAIEEMEGRLNEKQKRIAAVKDITSKLKTGNQLIDELSGLIYLADYDELSRNDFLSDELNKMVYRLNEFIGDLSKRLEQKTILEGEIVND